MKEKNDKWTKAITNIIKRTQEKRLIWYVSNHQKNIPLSNDEYVESVFESEYHFDRKFRLYKKHFKSERYTSIPVAVITNHNRINPERDEYWDSYVALEIIDDQHNILFEFPRKQSILNDLLNSVKYHVSGIGELLNDLLDDDD